MESELELHYLVERAKAGDIDAYGRLVKATQSTTYAIAFSVLRNHQTAQDATQEAYFGAFRRLRDLKESGAFLGWFRRIVVNVSMNMRKAHRFTLLRLDDVPVVPVLDETETTWSQAQRQSLSGALLRLSQEERKLCDLSSGRGILD
jgi:RNA polymerase sigma factor (sigma-70 family)